MTYYGYMYCEDGEPIGHYSSEQEAYDAATLAISVDDLAFGTKPFFIVLYHETELRWNTRADDIITEMEDNLTTDMGVPMAPSIISSDSDIKELDKALDKAIRGWIKDRRIRGGSLICWLKRFDYDCESGSYIEI